MTRGIYLIVIGVLTIMSIDSHQAYDRCSTDLGLAIDDLKEAVAVAKKEHELYETKP